MSLIGFLTIVLNRKSINIGNEETKLALPKKYLENTS